MSTSPADVRVVLCTVPEAGAEALVDALLRDRLIACANLVGPVRSRFWWDGKIDSATELLAVLKVDARRVDALTARIVELHEYDVPEVLVLDVASGHGPYLDWVVASCSADPE